MASRIARSRTYSQSDRLAKTISSARKWRLDYILYNIFLAVPLNKQTVKETKFLKISISFVHDYYSLRAKYFYSLGNKNILKKVSFSQLNLTLSFRELRGRLKIFTNRWAQSNFLISTKKNWLFQLFQTTEKDQHWQKKVLLHAILLQKRARNVISELFLKCLDQKVAVFRCSIPP